MAGKTFTQHLKLSALALALSITLTACTSTTTSNTAAPKETLDTTKAFSALSLSQADYQKLLDQADSASRFPSMILLARSAIVARDYTTAASVIAMMQQEALDPIEKDEASIIEALLYLNQGRSTDAMFSLNRINIQALPTAVKSFYYQVRSNNEIKLFQESHRVDYLFQACNDKITLMQFINPDAKQTVALQVVKHLQLLAPSELTVQLNQNTDPTMQGFLEYALLDSSKSTKVKQQLVKSWMEKYENHPLDFAAKQIAAGAEAAAQTPVVLDETSGVISLKEGDKVAVLLPLTGRFAASVGEPARLGILAALQDRNSKLKVTFYDTNRMTIEAITSALAQNGTNFIIGPILKPEVDALIATKINLPAIVFNQPASPRSGLFYYNLGPDYEGALAAAKIYADHKSRPLVITPESTRGERALAGFTNTWSQANEQNPVVCRYQDINTVTTALTTCPLNNADAIYINATANDVIKVRSSLPDNTPVYLTDRSYMGLNHSSSEVALSGAFLGDMPWLLTDSALKNDFMATLPKADPQVQRIFAVAYDSINLSFNLESLSRDSNDVLHGISGEQQLGQNGLIEMAPMWVQLGVNRITQ